LKRFMKYPCFDLARTLSDALGARCAPRSADARQRITRAQGLSKPADLGRSHAVNFARDVLDAAPPDRRALVARSREGERREWTFGEIAERAARLAGALQKRGVQRGDVVMTVIGNRPEWVLTMAACFRIGAVVLPCNEQLRAKDLRLRIDTADPKLIVADERNQQELSAAEPTCEVALIPDESLYDNEPSAAAELEPTDPCLITFTSGTTGEAKGVVHGQRYLPGQWLQASHWLGAHEGELVWCTAASGWSKSARNAFIAPWLTGAAALLHDARFDPFERLAILASEQVNVLCMAPTEYRVIAKRADLEPLPSLRGLVAAGEALNPEVLRAFREGTGLAIRDGYGQTETGQLTGMPAGADIRLGSMGRPLPGVALEVDDGELVLRDPASDPTFFVAYLGGEPAPEQRPWHTGDRVRQDDDGYLYFEGRTDDLIISAGYRIGPFEVESSLVSHPAVAEAAVVAAPDDERGAVVRAVVVLRDGYAETDSLARELQDHVKAETAPYKYPRIVDFASELPKTTSGKIQRALLREEHR
jgi:acyl-coenzyme A synthetase/AMP-(fatty) acid ligase